MDLIIVESRIPPDRKYQLHPKHHQLSFIAILFCFEVSLEHSNFCKLLKLTKLRGDISTSENLLNFHAYYSHLLLNTFFLEYENITTIC